MGLKKILHSDLAKSLVRLAADTAAPGVRPAIEQIIKDTRNGVYSEGAVRERLEQLTDDRELDALIRQTIEGILLNQVPLPPWLAGYSMYHPDGHRIFGSSRSPLLLPIRAESNAEFQHGGDGWYTANTEQAKPTRADSGFRWGPKSIEELRGVHPTLVQVANLGLKKSVQDFMIFDGLRTTAEQAEYVAKGTSTTMKSMHLPQDDGLSHAIDAVPVVKGQPVWDWEKIYLVILALDEAATELGVADKLVWGGAWDRRLSDFGGSPEAYKRECQLYAMRHPGKDFLDGPHLELRL